MQLLPRDINSVSNEVFLALSGIPARNSENLSQMCVCSILYWYRHFEIFRKRLSRGRRESLPFVGDLLQTRRRSALIVGKRWGPSLHCQIPISSFIPNHACCSRNNIACFRNSKNSCLLCACNFWISVSTFCSPTMVITNAVIYANRLVDTIHVGGMYVYKRGHFARNIFLEDQQYCNIRISDINIDLHHEVRYYPFCLCSSVRPGHRSWRCNYLYL